MISLRYISRNRVPGWKVMHVVIVTLHCKIAATRLYTVYFHIRSWNASLITPSSTGTAFKSLSVQYVEGYDLWCFKIVLWFALYVYWLFVARQIAFTCIFLFSLKLFFVLLLICRNPSYSENIKVCASCVVGTQAILVSRKTMTVTVCHMEILNCAVRFVFLSFTVSYFMPSNEKLLSTKNIKLKCSFYNNNFQLIFNPFELY